MLLFFLSCKMHCPVYPGWMLDKRNSPLNFPWTEKPSNDFSLDTRLNWGEILLDLCIWCPSQSFLSFADLALPLQWFPVCFRMKTETFSEDCEIVHALALDCVSSLTSCFLVLIFPPGLFSSNYSAFQLEVLAPLFSAHCYISLPSLCLIIFCLFISTQFKLCFAREFYSNLTDLVRFPCNTYSSSHLIMRYLIT